MNKKHKNRNRNSAEEKHRKRKNKIQGQSGDIIVEQEEDLSSVAHSSVMHQAIYE